MAINMTVELEHGLIGPNDSIKHCFFVFNHGQELFAKLDPLKGIVLQESVN
jgi:hypothetical protein